MRVTSALAVALAYVPASVVAANCDRGVLADLRPLSRYDFVQGFCLGAFPSRQKRQQSGIEEAETTELPLGMTQAQLDKVTSETKIDVLSVFSASKRNAARHPHLAQRQLRRWRGALIQDFCSCVNSRYAPQTTSRPTTTVQPPAVFTTTRPAPITTTAPSSSDTGPIGGSTSSSSSTTLSSTSTSTSSAAATTTPALFDIIGFSGFTGIELNLPLKSRRKRSSICTYDQCRARCSGLLACVGFTHNAPNLECFLYSYITGRFPSATATSAIKLGVGINLGGIPIVPAPASTSSVGSSSSSASSVGSSSASSVQTSSTTTTAVILPTTTISISLPTTSLVLPTTTISISLPTTSLVLPTTTISISLPTTSLVLPTTSIVLSTTSLDLPITTISTTLSTALTTVSSAPPATTTTPGLFQFLPQSGFVGTTGTLVGAVGTYGGCQAACEASLTCQGFTFDQTLLSCVTFDAILGIYGSADGMSALKLSSGLVLGSIPVVFAPTTTGILLPTTSIDLPTTSLTLDVPTTTLSLGIPTTTLSLPLETTTIPIPTSVIIDPPVLVTTESLTVSLPVQTTINVPPAPVTTTTLGVPAPVVTDQAFIDTVLRHHNVHRANHSANALTWNPILAASAKLLADTCIYGHNTGVGALPGYGQNIGAGYSATNMGSFITSGLYNSEVNNYKLGAFGTPPDITQLGQWGHFTQIVWKGTTSVGCYVSDCSANGLRNTLNAILPGIPPYFAVCNYAPAGNFVGLFGVNVGASLGAASIGPDYGCPSAQNCANA